MSSTRHAAAGAPLRQEKFASSFTQGLLANLVAKRCAALEGAEDRAAVWFLQWASWQPGGVRAIGCDPQASALLCLDPNATNIGPAIQAVKSWLQTIPHGVQTAVGRKVSEALDYSRDVRCLALIDGQARIGKSFEARTWCQRSAGLARYVQVPCSNDDISFFRAIAKALGVSSSLQLKAAELRGRIEDALEGGDLMLVLDEAHACWPVSWQRYALPSRVNWIMSIVNRSIPVALITTPQFYAAQARAERLTGWTSEQFIGRIGHVERLPDRLEKEDLIAVAKALLPEGDRVIWNALAGYSRLSKRHLASIEAIVKRSRWLAGKAGRSSIVAADVRTAINESVVPSDMALAQSLAAAGNARRNDLAGASRLDCETAASAPQLARAQF